MPTVCLLVGGCQKVVVLMEPLAVPLSSVLSAGNSSDHDEVHVFCSSIVQKKYHGVDATVDFLRNPVENLVFP